jgi:D-alanyl-D-alanine carboxypeptidase (penicillin-binding protein 5/6)
MHDGGTGVRQTSTVPTWRSARLRASRPAWLLALLLVALPVAGPVPAAAAATPGDLPEHLLPKAWILVDADTGRVLDARDEHTRRRPASAIKLLSVLTATRYLDPGASVPVSPRAAAMPPRKIGLTAGRPWPLADMVASALVVSANDAAVALGEASAGSLDGFAAQMGTLARDLGAVDAPSVDDPSGLDDADAHGDGDWISAWDLAVIGRAALTDPQVRALAGQQVVTFTDPAGGSHRLVNHNRLLRRYEGATGLKPGYTKAAGNTLVASATRGGRTMVVVVLDAPDLYRPVEALFDQGFATDPMGQTGPVMQVNPLPAPGSQVASTVANDDDDGSMQLAGSARDLVEWSALIGAGGALAVIELRRRRFVPR